MSRLVTLAMCLGLSMAACEPPDEMHPGAP
jgi:hypothetical protein